MGFSLVLNHFDVSVSLKGDLLRVSKLSFSLQRAKALLLKRKRHKLKARVVRDMFFGVIERTGLL